MGNKTALIGIHDTGLRDSLVCFAKGRGYDVTDVGNSEDMMTYSRSIRYGVYLMDLNLGMRGSSDISPAREVYGIVKERVERGDARFLGISANDEAVRNARSEGMPAEQKVKAIEKVAEMFS
jgi:hypothetical protein